MSHTLKISDTLYTRLKTTARARGLKNVEALMRQLVKARQAKSNGLRRRKQVVRRIESLRERLFAAYGLMPDSVELLRADRER